MEILPAWPTVPTAVRETQLEKGFWALDGLEGYHCVSVVFRYAREVLGQTYLPVTKGRVPLAQMEAQVHLLNEKIWRARSTGNWTVDSHKASVVVCTHDRTEDLRRCLPHLLPLIESGHEVIIVDSCPSDDKTKCLVSQFPQLIYVLEPCPGLSIARNCGIRASTQEFIAFTDDDAEADPLWLPNLLRNFEDPAVGMVTGLALPIELEKASQIWFEITNTFSRGFERRIFDVTNIDPLTAGLLGAGVNCAFRRSIFNKVGFFDDALGPGTPARAADDHEMFYRILAGGHRAVYDPSALVWHHHRRDWRALQSTAYNYGVAVYAWWMAALVLRREYGLLRLAPGWFCGHHLRHLREVLLRRPGAMPKDLAFAEFRGALSGLYAYFKSKRAMAEMRQRLHAAPDEWKASSGVSAR
jgi:GT2 family glycosyltransferase